MKKYLQIFFYSFKDNTKSQKELLVRCSFFFVILFIFSNLWSATNPNQVGIDQAKMIWYLYITETIVISLPIIQFEIESDIRSGDVAYYLIKPVNYLFLKLAENLGVYHFRFFVLLTLGFFACYFLSAGHIPSLLNITTSFLMSYIAGIVILIFQASIGIMAFKLQDCSALFWIWQRSSFLLGGLLMPLNLYPDWLRKIANYLPFSSMISEPASLMLQFKYVEFIQLFFKLFGWMTFGGLLAYYLYGKVLKQIKINGG